MFCNLIPCILKLSEMNRTSFDFKRKKMLFQNISECKKPGKINKKKKSALKIDSFVS